MIRLGINENYDKPQSLLSIEIERNWESDFNNND